MDIVVGDGWYIGLSAMVSAGAYIWNRNWVLWLLGSLLFSPVIAGIILMVAGDKK